MRLPAITTRQQITFHSTKALFKAGRPRFRTVGGTQLTRDGFIGGKPVGLIIARGLIYVFLIVAHLILLRIPASPQGQGVEADKSEPPNLRHVFVFLASRS